ncbi:hypothetical protein M3Y97_00884300 [Aphelenchoides bicaudatus]|nr:hypothetical protein M3Y97_00884300 [Aphelenchoides bicaudatus]
MSLLSRTSSVPNVNAYANPVPQSMFTGVFPYRYSTSFCSPNFYRSMYSYRWLYTPTRTPVSWRTYYGDYPYSFRYKSYYSGKITCLIMVTDLITIIITHKLPQSGQLVNTFNYNMVLLRTQSFVAKTPSGAITKSYSVPDIGPYISARQKYQPKWEWYHHYATYYRPSTYSKTPLRGDHFYHDA